MTETKTKIPEVFGDISSLTTFRQPVVTYRKNVRAARLRAVRTV